MKITDFQTLWQAVSRMQIDTIARTEIEQLEGEGIDTDLKKGIFSSQHGELYTVLKDGTIRKLIVYICDISNHKIEWGLPKFHIIQCRTLEEMRLISRSHRYKKASRTDGKFWIIKNGTEKHEKLDLCKNCLNCYNRIYGHNAQVETFDIQKYIETPIQHSRPYITDELDMATIPKSYAENWRTISNERKKYNNWICQECSYDCSQAKKYLHTHHIDADLANNKCENLRVLCIECHANQFMHEHIKDKQEYKEFLKLKGNYAN